jgi:zinc resistance-associated protein
MVQTKSLGKVTFLLLVSGILLLAGIQNVSAGEDKGISKPCHRGMQQDTQMSAEMLKNRNDFLQDTKELRKNMMIKRAEMRALMHGTNPDIERASVLAGELFDLREQLRLKAMEKGLPGRAFMGPMGMGCKMMQNDGPMRGGSRPCPSQT